MEREPLYEDAAVLCMESNIQHKELAATGIRVWSPHRPGKEQVCLVLSPESFTNLDEETGKPVAQVILEAFSEHFKTEGR